MNPFQTKHRHCGPILAVTLLFAATGVALAEQEASPTSPRTSNWLWSWFTSSPAPAAKPKPAAPARVAGQTEPGKPNSNCSSFSCITLVGIGF
jgi:hypothetical protein